jgi:hypothetical protein
MADTRRASVKEAARLLDTTEHAIRQRLYRGSLESEKDESGSVVVLLPEHLVGHTTDSQREGERDTQAEAAMSALVETLQDQNRILLEQLREANESNRENRRLLAALTQRIPEIEAPEPRRDDLSEPRESPQTASEEPYLTHAPPRPETPISDEAEPGAPYGTSRQEAEDSLHQRKRSWWREFLGME